VFNPRFNIVGVQSSWCSIKDSTTANNKGVWAAAYADRPAETGIGAVAAAATEQGGGGGGGGGISSEKPLASR